MQLLKAVSAVMVALICDTEQQMKVGDGIELF